VALKAGSCATETGEPRQVRKEATVSRRLRVPQGSLAGANCRGTTGKSRRWAVHGLNSYPPHRRVFLNH